MDSKLDLFGNNADKPEEKPKRALPSTSTTAMNKREQTTTLSGTMVSTSSTTALTPKKDHTQNQMQGYLHAVQERKNVITFELQVQQDQYCHGITFDPDICRTVMLTLMQEKNPVMIENYNLIPSRLNPGQDLKLTSKSKMTPISHQLHYEHKPPTPFTTELEKIATISPNTKINVQVVILGENPKCETKTVASGPIRLQTKYVADDTGITNLSTWDKNIDQLQVNNTYRLENL
ncbi:uncharacterized protein LOC135497104 [Lineus longissimus]|uniref:uncharacterized protein LOC135497104 n=1 Tax=Lineus longissimus TaxID=88925 RepID=UPI002B4F00C9